MVQLSEHTVVVGIDGSEASRSALRWAVEEARVRGCSVTAVHVWQVPMMAYESLSTVSSTALDPITLEQSAEASARATVADVVGDETSVPIEVSLRNGHAAEELVAAGQGADLLVVGSEGHGGFKGMLLGSVSTQVLHHSTCPVAVVRPGWTPAA